MVFDSLDIDSFKNWRMRRLRKRYKEQDSKGNIKIQRASLLIPPNSTSPQSFPPCFFPRLFAIWTSDICPRRAEYRMNQCLTNIATWSWTSNWRIKLAPERSVFLLFSKRPTHRRMTLNIKLQGKDINRAAQHKFLGVTFDDKLSWKPHIDNILGGTLKRSAALKKLSAQSVWRHPEWILKLHECVINSVWKYGALAYAAMGRHLWDKIRTQHSRSVKGYAGVPSYTSYSLLCDQLGIKEIEEELKTFAKKRIAAILAFSPFGKDIVSKWRDPSTTYKSPVGLLFEKTEAQLMAGIGDERDSWSLRDVITQIRNRDSRITRPDTRHKMRLVCELFTFKNNTGHTDGRTDGRTRPHIEMRRRI